jgi:hypothetical protein
MRIPIREQLGLLVVLCSLTAVGVISIATVRYPIGNYALKEGVKADHDIP